MFWNKKKDDEEVGIENEEEQESELDTLRKQLEEERAEKSRIKAENEGLRKATSEYSTRLNNETTGRISAEEAAVASGLSSNISEADKLEKEIALAYENGKFSEAASLTRKLTAVQANINDWEAKKTQVEYAKKNPVVAPVVPKPKTRSEQWVEDHPEFNTDETFKDKVMALHYAARAEKIKPDTEEYIKFINDGIGEKSNSRSLTAIPVTRTGSTTSNSSANEPVRLTREESEMAQITFPNLSAAEANKRYSEAKKHLTKSGKL